MRSRLQLIGQVEQLVALLFQLLFLCRQFLIKMLLHPKSPDHQEEDSPTSSKMTIQAYSNIRCDE